jgi:hypothetical protein
MIMRKLMWFWRQAVLGAFLAMSRPVLAGAEFPNPLPPDTGMKVECCPRNILPTGHS